MSSEEAAPAAGKGAPPPKGGGKGPGKGPGKGAGKGLSYKERKEAELRETEDRFSAAEGFAGKALTAEEAHIIENKGTEAQGSGEYDSFQPLRGYFACRKCGKPIYSYQAKFESGCGWPAFDKCYVGSISTKIEDDGTNRVEITCAACGAHLGHVFVEPGKHAKARSDQRHCANSMALQFVKHDPPAGTVLEEAVVEIPAAGDGPARQGLSELALLLEVQGDGTTFPGAGDSVAILYSGTLLATGEEFDNCWGGDPFEFIVDGGHVIQGWDDGVKRMPLGSRGLLMVPSALAYGERGMPGGVPPNADLLFDLQLVAVNGRRAPSSPEQERPTLAGFLHRNLSPLLRPALPGLLQQRPADPCRHLLQSLDGAKPEPPRATAAANAQEYAALLRPLLQELSMAVLGCFGDGEGQEKGAGVASALRAWLQENAQRTLGPPPQ